MKGQLLLCGWKDCGLNWNWIAAFEKSFCVKSTQRSFHPQYYDAMEVKIMPLIHFCRSNLQRKRILIFSRSRWPVWRLGGSMYRPSHRAPRQGRGIRMTMRSSSTLKSSMKPRTRPIFWAQCLKLGPGTHWQGIPPDAKKEIEALPSIKPISIDHWC
jgi:hypothetical protein